MPVQKHNYTNSLANINSPTGYTEDQLREFAEREARNEFIDPNASLNELIAYNERKRQEREANLAKGMAEYIKDPRYITRSLEAFKKANPYATLVDFTKFINSDTILKAYYTGTDAYRNLNDSQVYSDYRQFFPEQENIFNTLRKGSLEEQEDTNWFAKQVIDLGKGAEKVVRGLVSPFMYADKQIEAVDDLNKFPKEEITALKSKQMQAYKLTQELNNLKASNWYGMTDADRNRTVQKIDSIQKALESLNPTEREQQLIDSGVVRAYDRTMDYKLAVDKARADFEGNTVLSNLNPLLGYGNEIRGESDSYKALAREMDSRYLEYLVNTRPEDFTTLDHILMSVRNQYKNTSIGEAIGTIAPWIAMGYWGKGLSLIAQGGTAFGRYQDNILAQMERDPVGAVNTNRAFLGAVASTALDFYGSKFALDAPQKAIMNNLFNKSFTKLDQIAWANVDRKVKLLGPNITNRQKYMFYQQELASLAPNIQAELAKSLVASNNASFAEIGKSMLKTLAPEDSMLAGLVHGTAGTANFLAKNYGKLSKVGLAPTQFAKAGVGLAIENVGSDVFTQYGQGTDFNNLDTNSLIESGTSGLVTGGMFHGPSLAMHASSRAIKPLIQGLDAYAPMNNSAIKRMLDSSNFSTSEIEGNLKAFKDTNKANMEGIQTDMQKKFKSIDNFLQSEAVQNAGITGKTNEVTGEFSFDVPENAEITPQMRTQMNKLATTYNEAIKPDIALIKRIQDAEKYADGLVDSKQLKTFKAQVADTGKDPIETLSTNASIKDQFNRMSKANQDRYLNEILGFKSEDLTDAEINKRDALKASFTTTNAEAEVDETKDSEAYMNLSNENKQALDDKATELGINTNVLRRVLTEQQLLALKNLDTTKEVTTEDLKAFKDDPTLSKIFTPEAINQKTANKAIAQGDNAINTIKNINAHRTAGKDFKEYVKDKTAEILNNKGIEGLNQEQQNGLSEAIASDGVLSTDLDNTTSNVYKYLEDHNINATKSPNFDKAIQTMHDSFNNTLADSPINQFVAEHNEIVGKENKFDSEGTAEKFIATKKLKGKAKTRTYKTHKNVVTIEKNLSREDTLKSLDVGKRAQDLIKEATNKPSNIKAHITQSLEIAKNIRDLLNTSTYKDADLADPQAVKQVSKATNDFINNLDDTLKNEITDIESADEATKKKVAETLSNQLNGVVKAYNTLFSTVGNNIIQSFESAGVSIHGYSAVEKAAYSRRVRDREQAQVAQYRESNKKFLNNEGKAFKHLDNPKKVDQFIGDFFKGWLSSVAPTDSELGSKVYSDPNEIKSALANIFITEQTLESMHNLAEYITMQLSTTPIGSVDRMEYQRSIDLLNQVFRLVQDGVIETTTDNRDFVTNHTDYRNTDKIVNSNTFIINLGRVATTSTDTLSLQEDVFQGVSRFIGKSGVNVYKTHTLIDELYNFGFEGISDSWNKVFNAINANPLSDKAADVIAKFLATKINAEVPYVIYDFANKSAPLRALYTRISTNTVSDVEGTIKDYLKGLNGSEVGQVWLDLLSNQYFLKTQGLVPYRTKEGDNVTNADIYYATTSSTVEDWDNANTTTKDKSSYKTSNATSVKDNLANLNKLINSNVLADTVQAVAVLQMAKAGVIKGITAGLLSEDVIINSIKPRPVNKEGEKIENAVLGLIKNNPNTNITPNIVQSALGSSSIDANIIKAILPTAIYNARLTYAQKLISQNRSANASDTHISPKSSEVQKALEQLSIAYNRLGIQVSQYTEYDNDFAENRDPSGNYSIDAITDLVQNSLFSKADGSIIDLETFIQSQLGTNYTDEVKNSGILNADRKEVFNKVMRQYGKTELMITQEEANTLGQLFYGITDTDSLIKLLKLPTKASTVYSSNVSTNIDFSAKGKADNPLKTKVASKYQDIIHKACYGVTYGLNSLREHVTGDAINLIQHESDIAQALKTETNSGNFSPILSEFFGTENSLDGALPLSVCENIVGISFAYMDMLNKKSNEDFLKTLDPRYAAFLTKTQAQDANVVTTALGQAILAGMGLNPSGYLNKQLIGALGALGVGALTLGGVVNVKYAGLQGDTFRVVDQSAIGADKAGKACVITFNKREYNRVKNTINNTTYTSPSGKTRSVLKDAYIPAFSKDTEAMTAKDRYNQNKEWGEDYNNSNGVKYILGDAEIAYVDSNKPITVKRTIDSKSGIMKVELTNMPKSWEAEAYKYSNNSIKDNLVQDATKNSSIFYLPKHYYMKPDGTMYNADRLVQEVILNRYTGWAMNTEAYEQIFNVFDGYISNNKANKAELQADLFNVNKTTKEIQAIRSLVGMNPNGVIKLVGTALEHKRDKFLTEANKLLDEYVEYKTNPDFFEQKLYFNFVNTKNNREYLEAKGINPREHKILRRFFTRFVEEGHNKLELTGNNSIEERNKALLAKGAILNNLGLKHDKMTVNQVNEAISTLVSNTAFKQLLNDVKSANSTTGIIKAIGTYNNASSLPTYSYRGKDNKTITFASEDLGEYVYGLRELANIGFDKLKLLADNQSVTIDNFNLTIEIDGLTNGAALKAFGSTAVNADDYINQAIGLYVGSGDYAQYFTATDSSVRDLYEESGFYAVRSVIEQTLDSVSYTDAQALIKFLNLSFGTDKEGLADILSRSMLKTPFVSTNYGAGLEALKATMQQVIQDATSSVIYDLVNAKGDKNTVNKAIDWFNSALALNGSSNTIAFRKTTDRGTTKIVEYTLEEFLRNPQELQDCDLEIASNKPMAKYIDDVFTTNIYKGIDKLRSATNATDGIMNEVGSVLEQTIGKIVYKYLNEGINAGENLDTIIESVWSRLNPVVELGTSKTKMAMLSSKGSVPQIFKQAINGVLTSSDGKLVFRARTMSPLPTSVGSGLAPMGTQTIDGNIIQDIVINLRESGISFLAVHDAALANSNDGVAIAQALNKNTFDNVFEGSYKTISSLADLVSRAYKIAQDEGVDTSDMYKTLNNVHLYKENWKANLLYQLYQFKNNKAKGDDVIINQYQYLGLTGISINVTDLDNAIKAFSSPESMFLFDANKSFISEQFMGLDNVELKEKYFDIDPVSGTLSFKSGVLANINTIDELIDAMEKEVKDNTTKEALEHIRNSIKEYQDKTIFNPLTLGLSDTNTADALNNPQLGRNEPLGTQITSIMGILQRVDNAINPAMSEATKSNMQPIINNLQKGITRYATRLNNLPNTQVGTAIALYSAVTEGKSVQSGFIDLFGSVADFNNTDLFNDVRFELDNSDTNVTIMDGELDFDFLKQELDNQNNKNYALNNLDLQDNKGIRATASTVIKDITNQVRTRIKGHENDTIVLTMGNQLDILTLGVLQNLKGNEFNGKIVLLPTVSNRVASTTRLGATKGISKLKQLHNYINKQTKIDVKDINHNIFSTPNKFKDTKYLHYLTGVPFTTAFQETGINAEVPYLDYYKESDGTTNAQFLQAYKYRPAGTFKVQYFSGNALGSIRGEPINLDTNNVANRLTFTPYDVSKTPVSAMRDTEINYDAYWRSMPMSGPELDKAFADIVQPTGFNISDISSADTIESLLNYGDMVIATDSAGFIRDAGVEAFLTKSGLEAYRSVYNQYRREYKKRLQAHNDGLGSNTSLIGSPIYCTYERIGSKPLRVIFMPTVHNAITTTDIREGLRLSSIDSNAKEGVISGKQGYVVIEGSILANKLSDSAKRDTKLLASMYAFSQKVGTNGTIKSTQRDPIFTDVKPYQLQSKDVYISERDNNVFVKRNTLIAKRIAMDKGFKTVKFLGVDPLTYNINGRNYVPSIAMDPAYGAYIGFSNFSTNVAKRIYSTLKNTVGLLRRGKQEDIRRTNIQAVQHGYNRNSTAMAIQQNQFQQMNKTSLSATMDALLRIDQNRGVDSSWLNDTLGSMLVNSIHPMMLQLDKSNTGASMTRDGVVYAKVGTGVTAPTESALEILYHEALAHPVMELLSSNTTLQRQASQMYQYVMSHINPDMFDDINQGKEILDYIGSKQGAEAIGEFFAYATTNKAFRDAIARITPRKGVTEGIFSRVAGISTRIMEAFTGLSLTSTPNKPIAEIDRIFNHLYHVYNSVKELSQRDDLRSNSDKIKLVEMADSKIAKMLGSTIDSLNKLAYKQQTGWGKLLPRMTDLEKGISPEELRGQLGTRITPKSLPIGDNVLNSAENAINALVESTKCNNFLKEQLTDYVAEVFTSLRGSTSDNWEYIKLRNAAKQAIDVARNNASAVVNDNVKEIIKDLKPQVKNALTDYFVRTDMSYLFSPESGYDETTAWSLITDAKARDTEIKHLENSLLSDKSYGRYYVNASKGLADYLTKGINTSGLGYKNAYEIAHRSGVASSTETTVNDSVIQQIDALVSLYAIKAKDAENPNIIKGLNLQVIKDLSVLHNGIKSQEFANTYGDGAMRYHIPKGNVHGGNALGMMAVYPASQTKALAYAGSYGSTITPTKLDPFYKNMGINMVTAYYPFRSAIPVEAGVFAMTDIFNGRVSNDIRVDGRKAYQDTKGEAPQKVYDYLSLRIKNLNTANPSFLNPDSVDGTFVPTFDPSGQVVGANFELNPITTDRKIHKKHKIQTVLGDLHGSALERQHSPKINQVAIQAIKDIYNSNKATKDFVFIKDDSKNMKYRDYWSMMPEEVKEAFRTTGIPVEKRYLPLVTGKRQLSSKVIDEGYYDFDMQGLHTLRDKLTHYFRNGWISLGEEGASFLTKLGKENLIVKSLSVSINNYKSNYLSLINYGLSPKQAIEDQIEGLAQVNQLEQYVKQLDALELKKVKGTWNDADAKQARTIRNSLEALPIYPLYSNNILGTVSDDLSNTDRIVKDFIDQHLGEGLSRMAHEVAFDPSSKVFTVLRDFNSIGDKIGKYALYKNLPKSMSQDEKFRTCQELFVDYSIPLPTGFDFMEATGMANFMKYGFGIQKAMFNMATKHPSTSLATYLTAKGIGAITYMPTIFDSFLGLGTLNQGLQIPGLGIFTSSIERTPYGQILLK